MFFFCKILFSKSCLCVTTSNSGYINQSLEVDGHFPLLDIDEFDYKTDVFDDEEEEELKFSDSESDQEEIFSDEYVDEQDDGIVVDVSESFSINISVNSQTSSTSRGGNAGTSSSPAIIVNPSGF